MREGGRPAGDALHADPAGAVAGQVAGALAPGQLIGHWCGRRLGEFWVQEVAVAGEAAATRGWRDEDLPGEGAAIARSLSWVPAWCTEQTGCSATDANLRATVSRSNSRSWA